MKYTNGLTLEIRSHYNKLNPFLLNSKYMKSEFKKEFVPSRYFGRAGKTS